MSSPVTVSSRVLGRVWKSANNRADRGNTSRQTLPGRRCDRQMIRLAEPPIGDIAATGRTAFYYNVPTRYRKMGCVVPNEPLGTDYAKACGEGGRAETLNGLFDEWMDARKGLPVSSEAAPRIGTIDWLFREYRQSRAYLDKVKPRSRRNYEWNMREICDTLTKRGDRVAGRATGSGPPKSWSCSAERHGALFTACTPSSFHRTFLIHGWVSPWRPGSNW